MYVRRCAPAPCGLPSRRAEQKCSNQTQTKNAASLPTLFAPCLASGKQAQAPCIPIHAVLSHWSATPRRAFANPSVRETARESYGYLQRHCSYRCCCWLRFQQPAATKPANLLRAVCCWVGFLLSSDWQAGHRLGLCHTPIPVYKCRRGRILACLSTRSLPRPLAHCSLLCPHSHSLPARHVSVPAPCSYTRLALKVQDCPHPILSLRPPSSNAALLT
ncbi:hypothetical protein B0H63DRAFT_113950 [Podospora didyma]|uniref:Uncharacterized protein n=1 Tax=Podospora didyma TaxID=330526 RepID=A0AAE0NZA7_9PEZI|nr:hypothetical protein B0H63DRAFT_113950 [Podospora didyma]